MTIAPRAIEDGQRAALKWLGPPEVTRLQQDDDEIVKQDADKHISGSALRFGDAD